MAKKKPVKSVIERGTQLATTYTHQKHTATVLPKFDVGLQVKVPKEVYDGKNKPHIVGYEWADGNRLAKVKSETYIYYVRLEAFTQAFVVSEEELTKWGN